MKKSIITIAAVSLLLLNLNSISAQKVWTLEECITYAHQNNLQIKKQELASRMTKNNYFQSKLAVLPSVNLGASRDLNYGRSVDPFTNDYITKNSSSDRYYASSYLNIFNGLQTVNTIQQSKYAFLSSEQDIDKIKNDITLEIATAYLQILFCKELLEISESQYNVTLLQVEKTRKLVEVGNSAKGELYRMEAQAANEKLNVTNAKNQLKLAYLDLTQLLDLDSVGGFDIIIPSDISIDTNYILKDVVTIYDEALNYLPQIKSAEYELKSAEKNLSVQWGRRSPQIYLQASYYTGYSSTGIIPDINAPYDRTIGYVNGDITQPVTVPDYPYIDYQYNDQIKDNANKYVSIGINIPIFNQYQVNRDISNAKISLNNSRLDLDLTKQLLYKEIQQSHADAIAALEKYRSSMEAVKSNEEAFVYTQQKLDVGLVSSVDYNIAKNDLLKAKSDLLQSKYEYIFKTKILDFYSGHPIVL
jgi:outer membrane protein